MENMASWRPSWTKVCKSLTCSGPKVYSKHDQLPHSTSALAGCPSVQPHLRSCRRSHSLSKFRNSNVSEKWKCCDHLSHSQNYYHEDGVATNVLWAFSESSAEKQFWNRLVVVDCNLLCAAAVFSVVREVLASGNSSVKPVGTKSKHEPNKLAKL